MSYQNTDEMLRDIVRIASASRDFCAATYAEIDDAETRTTFAFIADEKSRLVADLLPWIGTPADLRRRSAAEPVEAMYRAARAAFDRRATVNVAGALGFGEDQLLACIDRAHEQTRLPELRRLLKAHRIQLQTGRQAMWRLDGRLAA